MVWSTGVSARVFISRIALFVLLIFTGSSVKAELILTAPPREDAITGQAQYGPLAAQLSELLGERVVYRHPKGWLHYQREMRADKYDIVFDGPHFMSWRIKQFNHTPIAKLPGKLGFVIITAKHNLAINKVDDLVNVSMCASAPPNLSTVTVLARLRNPARLPRLINVKGGADSVYHAFSERKCEVAIISEAYFSEELAEEDREKLKAIYKSIPVVNQGITVSSRVSPQQRTLIAATLTTNSKGVQPTLRRYAPEADSMLPASHAEYDFQYKLLADVVFGWEITNPNVIGMNSY